MLAEDRLRAIIALQAEIAGAALDLEAVMRIVVQRASALCEASAGVVELVEGDEMVYRAVSGTASTSLGLRLKRATSLSGRCVAERVPLRCDDASVDPRVDAAACKRVGVASMICVPLVHGDDAVGVLKVVSNRTRAFTDDHIEMLRLLGGLIGISLHQAQSYEARKAESLEDALTRLPNRRAFDQRLAHELARHQRYQHPLSLGVFDLDRFKVLNDTHGHAAGDLALQQVGAILQLGLRSGDTFFRIGGDEFALLLPDTRVEAALLAVQRHKSAVKAAELGHGVLGISSGVAEALEGDTAQMLVARADAQLYAAKRARRSAA